jgi:hypothetical protein
MTQVDRFSVTMPPELGEGVRQAAVRLRNELLGIALEVWESEDGSFTEAELTAAASRLGLTPRSDVA